MKPGDKVIRIKRSVPMGKIKRLLKILHLNPNATKIAEKGKGILGFRKVDCAKIIKKGDKESD